MDFNKLIARVKAILLTPKTEWPLVADEVTTPADLYKNYIVWLAAIPAICSFLKYTLFGVSIPFAGTFRVGIANGLSGMIVAYVLALAGTFIVALIIDALAPTFGAQKNQTQALKTVAYAYTASWIAGIAYLLPGIGTLIVLVGGIYSIYLLYLGLPFTMKCPPDRAAGYTAVTIVVAIVLALVMGMVTSGVMGTRSMLSGASTFSHDDDHFVHDSDGQFDKDSNMGKLQAWSKKVEAAGKQMESAQKSGDSAAQSAAMGSVMAATLGGGDAVEALAPDRIKTFLPESLDGMQRTATSSQRNGALGMQVSEAKATYANEAGKSVDLEITDTGGARGLMSLAGWAAMEQESSNDRGYEKTYKLDGRLVHEKWDTTDKHGEFTVVVGDRFTVQASGTADSIDVLKSAVASVEVNALEKLKTEGVKGS